MNIQSPTITPHKSELRPLPMRITQLQFERLKDARGRDGLSVQEHVRRSLDLYLAKIEREATRTPNPGDLAASQDQLPATPSPPAQLLPAAPPRKAPRLRSR